MAYTLLLQDIRLVHRRGADCGTLEPDESVFEGCLREYREELGIEMRMSGMALVNENFYTCHGQECLTWLRKILNRAIANPGIGPP